MTAIRFAGIIHDFVMLDALRRTYTGDGAIAAAIAFIASSRGE